MLDKSVKFAVSIISELFGINNKIVCCKQISNKTSEVKKKNYFYLRILKLY